MSNHLLYLEVIIILHICQTREGIVPVRNKYSYQVSNYTKRDVLKSIEANKIDITLKLNSNPQPSCSKGNNEIDMNSLKNLIPPSTCEETTVCAPSILEEITTIIPITNCQQTTESFTCTKEGTFGDAGNCDDFYICHRKSRSDTLERIKLTCPKGTAFDEGLNKCTKRAKALCLLQQSDYIED